MTISARMPAVGTPLAFLGGCALDGIVLRPFAGKGLHRVIALLKRRSSKDTPAAAELLKMLSV